MKLRDSKYELLRIIAMFLIVLHHSIIHGVFDTSLSNIVANPINTEVLTILESGGKIGVFLFVLITGYFMSDSHISIKKLVKLWLPIFFWSVFLCLVISPIADNGLKIKYIVKSLFPIIFNKYWFMTAYFFMYLLIPFLNVIVQTVNTKIKIILFILLGLVLIVSSVGTTTEITTFFGEDAGSMLLNFCIVYCWGGLIKKYKDKISKENISRILFIIIFIQLVIIQILFILFFKTQNVFIWKLIKQFVIGPWTLGIVVIACLCFIQFNNFSLKYNKWINKVATTTFGIYLISDNNYVRGWLWHEVFHTNTMLDKPYIIGYLILISVLVFIICSILEYFRKKAFSKIEDNIGNKLLIIQDNFINKIGDI